MIQAGGLDAPAERADAVRQHGGAQQHHVGRIGQQGALHRRLRARRMAQAHPPGRSRRLRFGAEQRVGIDRHDLDRPAVQPIGEKPAALVGAVAPLAQAVGGLFRRQMRAHVDLMNMSVLGAMEADLDDQNGLAVLRGDHLTIGEAAPQKMLGHVIVHRLADIARAQEGCVEAVGEPPLPFGLRRGHQRLRDRLPAEDAPRGPIQPFAARGKRRSRHGINQAANVLRPYQGYILSHEDHIVGSG